MINDRGYDRGDIIVVKDIGVCVVVAVQVYPDWLPTFHVQVMNSGAYHMVDGSLVLPITADTVKSLLAR